MAKRMDIVGEHVQGSITKAQERQQLQAGKRRREVDFKVGDEVYLSTKHFQIHPNNPLPEQTLSETPSYEVNGDIEWEVEKILGVRLVRNELKYRVKWVNQDNDPAEYLAENLCNAPMALRDYHELYPKLPGPPANLDYWLKCAEQDEYPKRRDDDNIQVTR
jgi:hypothetical protein